MTQEMREQRTEKWHIGKEIPLALLFLMAGQTGVGIWWAATQTAKTDTLIQMVAEFRNNQYTKDDARRDNELSTTRHQENRRRIEVLEQRNLVYGGRAK